MNKIKLDEVEIRMDLRPGDLGYVTYMHGHLYQQEYNYGIGFEAYVAQGFYEFYQNLNKDLDRVWIAEHRGKIVGFLLLMHREPGEAQLRYFILDPGYRGIGLGKKLSLLYMEYLMKKGYKRSYLWTTHELFAAANIYRKMGFRLTEEIASEAFGKPLKEQRYDLFLNDL
jgi:ribosomal protein S18 acetylase RimI-like enzyme